MKKQKQRRERESTAGGTVGPLIRSSASSESLRIRMHNIIVGGRPTTAPRSSNPRAHGVGTWSRARRRRAAAYCRSRPCPGSRDEGAERRVLPGLSVAGERGWRRRRAPVTRWWAPSPLVFLRWAWAAFVRRRAAPFIASDRRRWRRPDPEFAAFTEDLPAGWCGIPCDPSLSHPRRVGSSIDYQYQLLDRALPLRLHACLPLITLHLACMHA
jgi:hypothetical protein